MCIRDRNGTCTNKYAHVAVVRGAGQHARPSRKHCKPCAKHAHAPPPRARTCWYKFHSVEITNHPVPVHRNNKLKQQRDGARETTRTTNYELLGNGWATRAPERANTAKRAPDMRTHYHHVRVLVGTSFIKWNFQTIPYQSCETTS